MMLTLVRRCADAPFPSAGARSPRCSSPAVFLFIPIVRFPVLRQRASDASLLSSSRGRRTPLHRVHRHDRAGYRAAAELLIPMETRHFYVLRAATTAARRARTFTFSAATWSSELLGQHKVHIPFPSWDLKNLRMPGSDTWGSSPSRWSSTPCGLSTRARSHYRGENA